MTVSRLTHNGQRFQVSIPWRSTGTLCVPSNRATAQRRMSSLLRTLEKADGLKAKYDQTIVTYLEKQYIRVVMDNGVSSEE